jgi:hypothetical protein
VQHAAPQLVAPPTHAALQAIVEALHPVEGQVVVAGAGHWPLALQICAAVCTPPMQVCPAPHEVPALLLVVSTHDWEPVEHEKDPFLQGLVGAQLPPSLQAEQTPEPLQTMLVPQLAPVGLLPVSTQTSEPVAQENAPVLQGFPGWHVPPAVHAPHVPPRHTRFVPHEVPSGNDVLLSVHVGVPVEHISVPL